MGLIKSVVFAALIAWICLGLGYLSSWVRGTDDVSRVSANSVVSASIGILFADYLLSALLP